VLCGAPAARAGCPVTLDGDPALVDQLRIEVAAFSDDGTPCVALSARCWRNGDQLEVAVQDATGRSAQRTFELTGGLHATGLFSPDGGLLCVREDVGRHNAMDKVIGWAFGAGLLPLTRSILCVSGRLSFELVQKAAVAGCPVVVAVGAPSSLAVELGDDRGVTLCGFVRDGSATVYTEPGRVVA